MQHIGTIYGGWYLPEDIDLDENSIIYSGGVGEDISFDLALQHKYNCNMYLIDPTKKAIKHFEECIQYFDEPRDRHANIFTGNIQKDYYDKISNLSPNINKFNYINIGLWNKKDQLKFFKQDNQSYVSQSLIPNMFGQDFDIVEVTTLKI